MRVFKKMRVTTLSLGRTVNTGNYSSRRYELSVEVESGETALDCFQRASILLDSMIKQDMEKPPAELVKME